MNILLIKSTGLTKENPGVTYPLGLMYLSAMVKHHSPSYKIRIIDLRVTKLSTHKLAEIVESFNPQIVGISAVTMEAINMHEVAAVAKDVIPDSIVITGGPHPTAFYKKILEDPNIDYAVIGEGEETFLELLHTLEKGGDITRVNGIAYRKDNEVQLTPARKYIENLDNLPMPDWDAIDIDLYSRFYSMTNLGKRRYMAMFTSRSCPYRCIYCHNIFGKGFRARSPENVIQEIDILYNKYRIKDFEILDDIFNFDKYRAEKICDLIFENNYDITLSFPNGLRTDRLERVTLEKMRRAGTRYISVAVESASPRIQKLIKKNLHIEKVNEMIDIAVSLKIFTNGYFMLGFPTETMEELNATVNFALKSRLHTAHFFIVTPFEGTELYTRFKELVKNNNINFSEYNYYRASFKLSEVTPRKLFYVQLFAYLRFYFNPVRMVRICYAYFLNSFSWSDIFFYFWYVLSNAVIRLVRGII